jgi:hypothetical protein
MSHGRVWEREVWGKRVLASNHHTRLHWHRYHLLHPDYIMYRIKELQRAYALRVLLVQVSTASF